MGVVIQPLLTWLDHAKRRIPRWLVLALTNLFPSPCQLSPEGRSDIGFERVVSFLLCLHHGASPPLETRLRPASASKEVIHAGLCGLKGLQGLVHTFAPPSAPSHGAEMNITCSLGTSSSILSCYLVITFQVLHYSVMIALRPIFWVLPLSVSSVHGVAIPNE
jgi:hypothetical protein